VDLGVLAEWHMWIVGWLFAAIVVVMAALVGIALLGLWARTHDPGM